jgi:hypothetical protein
MREILQIETGTRSRCLPRLERALKALRVNVPQLELDLAAWAAKRGGHCGWAEYLPDLTPVCIPGFCVATIGNPEKNFIIVTVGFAPPHDAEHFGAGRLMFKFTTKSGDLLAGVDGRPPVPVESIEIWTGGDAEVENFQEFLTCAPVALRAWGAGGQNPWSKKTTSKLFEDEIAQRLLLKKVDSLSDFDLSGLPKKDNSACGYKRKSRTLWLPLFRI